jgi:hypothetical protein
MTATNRFI